MNKNIKVYLDTNVLKFGIESARRLVPRNQSLNVNGKEIQFKIHDIFDIPVHEKVRNQEPLYKGIKLLPRVINFAKQGKFAFCTNFETMFEFWGILLLEEKKSYFEGSEIKEVQAPIKYSRILAGFGQDSKTRQFEFLKSIKDKRFQELQKVTGAYQGENKYNRNQLLDAFHFWCAEYNKCDYFLTLDFKMINHLRKQKKFTSMVKIVSPVELLNEIKNT